MNYSSRSTNNLHVVVGHILDNKRDSVSNLSAMLTCTKFHLISALFN
jgi:hypothetical protein